MKIGFDAKRAIRNFTGLGNYSRFVINNLAKLYPANTYELFSPSFPSEGRELKPDNTILFVKNGVKPLWRTFWLAKEVKDENIEIFHGLSNELPYGINRTGVKSVVTIHDLIFLRYPRFYPRIDRVIYDIKAKYACKVADRIVAVSECTKRDIIEYYNIDPDKIDVVHQGCFSVFKNLVSDKQKEAVKEKYGLPDKYILSVGSIEERKNILLVVKALKLVPHIHFVAIGKQRKYAQKVKDLAQKEGLADRVHILSGIPLEDLPAILQASQIFVYPSVYEGFGIPIIEALNSRIPVIGAIGSCLEEAGGPGSLYVNPYDEHELAEAIEKVLTDTRLRENMIEAGMEYVARFEDKLCTDSLMKVYEKLL